MRIFLKFGQNFLSKAQLKMFSKKTIIKLFVDQSEVSALQGDIWVNRTDFLCYIHTVVEIFQNLEC